LLAFLPIFYFWRQQLSALGSGTKLGLGALLKDVSHISFVQGLYNLDVWIIPMFIAWRVVFLVGVRSLKSEENNYVLKI